MGNRTETLPGQDVLYDYDDASICPPGVSCTNVTGRLVRARTEVACNGASPVYRAVHRGYDAHGRLAAETVRLGTLPGDFTTGYAWDLDSNLAAVTYPSGRRVSYVHDGAASNSDAELVARIMARGRAPSRPT